MTFKVARIKSLLNRPPEELCCADGIAMQQESVGLVVMVDLNDTICCYGASMGGHCGQTLPYDKAVMAYDAANPTHKLGYVPFDLIDISEG